MIVEPLILGVLRNPANIGCFSLLQWDLLIRQARHSSLLAHLAATLDTPELRQQIPIQPRQHLEWAAIDAQRHLQAVHAEVAYIRKALEDIPFVLLKGAAYAMAALPHAAGRLFSDIDILVPKASIDQVEHHLMVHGWMATHHDAYDQRYYREWMHEIPPLEHIRRQSVIDVHHAILPLTMRLHPNSSKLLGAAITVSGHPGLMVLSPVDMLLHSAAHLFYEGELPHGLRDLLDLDGMLRVFGRTPDFWKNLVGRAVELELSRCLFYALRYCRMMLDTPIPEPVMNEAETGQPMSMVLPLMDAIYRRALLPDHDSCRDRYTGIARKALYIRANWLRMPPLLLARHLFHKAFVSKKDE